MGKYIIIICIVVISCACNREYSKVVKSSDVEYKLEMADKYYEKGDCDKCIPLYEEILIYFKGRLFAKFITATAQTIQRKLIYVLLHTPLSWFDVTPTGRIISRTTKDQDDLDSNLAFNVQFAVQNLLITFCSILVIGIATPLYLVFAVVSLVVYFFLIRYYMLTAVELKRLEANSRAPLISHIQ